MTFDEWADGKPVYTMECQEIWDAAVAATKKNAREHVSRRARSSNGEEMTEHQERMLECAGRMADTAGVIVSESLHSLNPSPCGAMALGAWLEKLKVAVKDYNEATLEAHRAAKEAT